MPTITHTLLHHAEPPLPPSPQPPLPFVLQVVAVLSAALSDEVAGQLNRRKSRMNISLGRKASTSSSQAKGETSITQQPTPVDHRMSFSVARRPPAAPELQRSSSPAAAAPLANITSGALLSDRTSVADLETSTPRSNSSSIEARSRASKPAAAAASSSSSIKRQEKGGADAVPAAQGCGCVIC